MTSPTLEVTGLTTQLELNAGGERSLVNVVEEVSFTVHPGKTLGLVGESGCGKSVTALSLLRLLTPSAQVVAGKALLEGRDLLSLSEAELRRVRGNRASLIFQDPMASLNPVHTVGAQVAEGMQLHRGTTREQARVRAVELLGKVGIPAPEERVKAHPHELSGGMRQRVMIAMALACDPVLLIADEPTTALDVTLQAQILGLLAALRAERGMGVLLITHDLGVVAEHCDDVAVMYAGRIVERSAVRPLFARPLHPYSAALLRSLPTLEDAETRRPLSVIAGRVPSLGEPGAGCAFRERCPRATEVCRQRVPALEEKRPEQWAACHHPLGTEVSS